MNERVGVIKGDSNHCSVLDLEGRSLGEFALATSWFTQNILAVVASDDGLSVAEDDCCLVASSALNIHKVGVGSRHKSLKFVFVLFSFKGRVKQISVHTSC